MTGAFVMTDEEIRRSYLRAKGRSTQVRILAELNAVDVSAMQAKLIELGLMEKPKPVRRKPAPVRHPTATPTPAPAAKPTAEPSRRPSCAKASGATWPRRARVM